MKALIILAIAIVPLSSQAKPSNKLEVIPLASKKHLQCVKFKIRMPPPPPSFKVMPGGRGGCPKEFAICVREAGVRRFVSQMQALGKWITNTMKSCMGVRI